MVNQQVTTPMPARPTADAESGTVIDDRYTLLDLLGQGGMATVYRARDERLGRLVAFKIIDDHDTPGVGSMLREDRALVSWQG